MPTGVALPDARDQLFQAAERVLVRDGPSGLTSRAVTAELGVAKGVLHRHFANFDTFVAELVRSRVGRLAGVGKGLERRVGRSSVVANLTDALTEIFDPVALAVVSLAISRDQLRAELRKTTPSGVPLLAEAVTVLSSYLAAEQEAGRLVRNADPDALALTLIGTGHLLFAGELGALPSRDAVEEVTASVMVGVLS